MKKLVITAHPNPKGFTHRIAQRFIEVSKKKGHEVLLMNLYDDQRKQDYLMMDENNKPVDDEKRNLIQEKIHRANELVFVFPLRWFDAPAILKNRFDMNMTSKFAYIYKKGWLGLLPYRLLKGKSVRVFFTAGSPNRVLWTFGIIILMTWFFTRIFYVGMKLSSRTTFWKLPVRRSPEEREEMLATVERIASK